LLKKVSWGGMTTTRRTHSLYVPCLPPNKVNHSSSLFSYDGIRILAKSCFLLYTTYMHRLRTLFQSSYQRCVRSPRVFSEGGWWMQRNYPKVSSQLGGKSAAAKVRDMPGMAVVRQQREDREGTTIHIATKPASPRQRDGW